MVFVWWFALWWTAMGLPVMVVGLCGAGCWLRLVCLWVELLVMFAVLFEL